MRLLICKGLGKNRKQCKKKGVKGALGTTFICFTMASSTRGAVQVLVTYNTEPLEDVLDVYNAVANSLHSTVP